MKFLIPSTATTAPGVYAIRTTLDARCYIGSTQNLRVRYHQHKAQLKKGTHHATRLQEFANEHGLDSLSFTLLELASPGQDLRQLEQHYFDTHRPFEPQFGFNNAPTAWGTLLATTEQKVVLSLSADLTQQVARLQPTTGISSRLTFLRMLLADAVHQYQARRDGTLLSLELQSGEAARFEEVAQERNTSLSALVRMLLLQECYQGRPLKTGGNDQALAEAVAQARGIRSPKLLLRSLLYDEAWRLGIKPQGVG